jgi:hypothetical protein
LYGIAAAGVLRLETRHFLVGPELGEDMDVVLEKGKVLHIKALTPGIEVRGREVLGSYTVVQELANSLDPSLHSKVPPPPAC